MTLHNKKATFSQFFLVEQNIRHDPSGITSKTKPPKQSGSILIKDSEYCK